MSEAFIQLISLGPIWVIFHCSGMCGTLLTGLDLTGFARGEKLSTAVSRILQYQLGRSLVYGMMGFLAGLLGDAWSTVGESAGGTLALLVGFLIVTHTLIKVCLRFSASSGLVQIGGASDFNVGLFERYQSSIRRLVPLAALRDQPIALGIVMAFLPCMLPIWVMGLAAVSGNALVGMGLMLLLVAMTSLSILLTLLAPGFIVKRFRLRVPYFQDGLFTLSGIWMVMIGLAALDFIEHAHFRIGGGLVMMFW